MFNFLRSSEDCNVSYIGLFPDKLKNFLETSDSAYCLTFKQMDMSHIAKFVSRGLYMNIYKSLTYERPWVGVSNKFKSIKWSVISNTSDKEINIVKSTIFDKVSINKQLKLSVADDYKEMWTIIKNSNNDYIIQNIVLM